MSAPIDIEADRRELPDIVAQNPVFDQEFDFQADHDIEMNKYELYKLKKIFSIADLAHVGHIGPKQFKELMVMLGIEPTDVRAPAPAPAPAPRHQPVCIPRERERDSARAHAGCRLPATHHG